MSYRHLPGNDEQTMPLMLHYRPLGNGLFERACEADTFMGLIAALMESQEYEHTFSAEKRLVKRMQLAAGIEQLYAVFNRTLQITDTPTENGIDVSSDEPMITSLEAIGYCRLVRSTGNVGEKVVEKHHA